MPALVKVNVSPETPATTRPGVAPLPGATTPPAELVDGKVPPYSELIIIWSPLLNPCPGEVNTPPEPLLTRVLENGNQEKFPR